MIVFHIAHRRLQHHLDKALDGPFLVYRTADRSCVLSTVDVDGRNLPSNVQQVLANLGRRIHICLEHSNRTAAQRCQSKLRIVPLDGVHRCAGPKPESTEGRPWGQSLKKPSGAPLNLG